MTKRFQGHFENGVIVPEEHVELPEKVTFTISVEANDATDPRPAGGVELVDWRARHRIQIDPQIARAIAEDPEFNVENS